MKKTFNLLVLLALTLLLVSCGEKISSFHKVSVNIDDLKIGVYLVKDNETFDETLLESVIKEYEIEYWSFDSKGLEKFEFTFKVTYDFSIYGFSAIENGEEPGTGEEPGNGNGNNDIDLITYYQNKGIENKLGQELRDKLYALLNTNISIKSYGGNLNSILLQADEHPNDTKSVYTIYDGAAMLKTAGGSAGDKVWNKEHVIPRSWYNKTYKSHEGDIHNLRISRASINSDRGNLSFIDTTGQARRHGLGFYPGDDHKGDSARIAMYMMIMLPDTIKANKVMLGNTPIETLLKWHFEDPVDAFEIRRNNILYGEQGNRNPFIDHPEFANLIWNY